MVETEPERSFDPHCSADIVLGEQRCFIDRREVSDLRLRPAQFFGLDANGLATVGDLRLERHAAHSEGSEKKCVTVQVHGVTD